MAFKDHNEVFFYIETQTRNLFVASLISQAEILASIHRKELIVSDGSSIIHFFADALLSAAPLLAVLAASSRLFSSYISLRGSPKMYCPEMTPSMAPNARLTQLDGPVRRNDGLSMMVSKVLCLIHSQNSHIYAYRRPAAPLYVVFSFILSISSRKQEAATVAALCSL